MQCAIFSHSLLVSSALTLTEECSRQDTRSTIEPHRTSNPSNIVSLIEGIVIVSIDVRPW